MSTRIVPIIDNDAGQSRLAADAIENIFDSSAYVLARRRVFRQLLQALIYEKTLRVSEETENNGVLFTFTGADVNGNKVAYTCRGRRRPSFGRIRLTDKPLMRIDQAGCLEADSVSRFLDEVRESFSIFPEYLERFKQELENTVIKDAMSLHHQANDSRCLRDADYDGIESRLGDGHPYHPCYKSRIGFDYRDNACFGPEFSPLIRPLWLAVRKEHCQMPISSILTQQALWLAELGDARLSRFHARIAGLGESLDDYALLPVHPWQWRRVIVQEYGWDLQQRRIIFLGSSEDDYRPQQSIRTLSNATRRDKSYLKLALNILNTSTTRGLAEHTIVNAPAISDWLKAVAHDDVYLRERLRTVFLAETAAVSYRSPVSPASPGSLACIWRESLHPYLDSDEEALPFSALTTIDRDGRPLIDRWLVLQSCRAWLQQLLDVSVTPLIHLLYAHGVALESHAQNIILLHKKGFPLRIALKDFHDGVRFIPAEVSRPIAGLQETPEEHLSNNRSSYIHAREPDDVRDFLYSAFFSMNLSELALFMQEHYALPESEFWTMTAACIMRYQQAFPDLQDRFARYDLFAEQVTVEAHTRRRLQSETSLRVNRVRNPLRQFNHIYKEEKTMEPSV